MAEAVNDDVMAVKVIKAIKSLDKYLSDKQILFFCNPVSKGKDGLHRLLAVDYDVMIRCEKACGWLIEKEGGKVSFSPRGFKKHAKKEGVYIDILDREPPRIERAFLSTFRTALLRRYGQEPAVVVTKQTTPSSTPDKSKLQQHEANQAPQERLRSPTGMTPASQKARLFSPEATRKDPAGINLASQFPALGISNEPSPDTAEEESVPKSSITELVTVLTEEEASEMKRTKGVPENCKLCSVAKNTDGIEYNVPHVIQKGFDAYVDTHSETGATFIFAIPSEMVPVDKAEYTEMLNEQEKYGQMLP